MGGNFKIRYIGDGSNRYFTYNKIYEIKDGVLILDNGTRLTNIQNFSSICYNINATFEEIKEEGENRMEDLRELIKPCYVVRFRGGVNSWGIAMNRSNGEVGFNSIDNLQRGIIRMSSFDEKLLDNSNMSEYDIMEIRGYADVDQTRIDNRPLIWKRNEKSSTQLKLEELEKKQREIADEMEKLRKEL